MIDMNAIELNNLSYSYLDDWTRKRRHALHSISLAVSAGETFGFLGHNGAGKTTTIKAILGLTRPSSGSIRIFGQDAALTETRKLIGYLPEQPYFYDNLRVQETMAFYATLAGISRADRTAKVSSALKRVGLLGRERSKMRSLSKGLMQRVAMAQAIVATPKLLILDEPFSGLDPIGRKEFRDLILELKTQGVTIFMSSHILSDVEHICDRASILVKGELKAIFQLSGSNASLQPTGFEICVRNTSTVPASLNQQTSNIVTEQFITRFHYSDRAIAEQALVHAVSAGAEIVAFQIIQPSLEDAFVKLTKENTKH